jgi:hypothetical protein
VARLAGGRSDRAAALTDEELKDEERRTERSDGEPGTARWTVNREP